MLCPLPSERSCRFGLVVAQGAEANGIVAQAFPEEHVIVIIMRPEWPSAGVIPCAVMATRAFLPSICRWHPATLFVITTVGRTIKAVTVGS